MGDQLQGKVAIVTGGGQGLGRAISHELAESGSHVAILEIDPASSRETATQLEQLGVRSLSCPTDIRSGEQVRRAFAKVVETFGRLDILVNNAGISRIGSPTHEVSDEDWQDSLAVMQTGVFYCMRAAGKLMIPQGSGSIVNISSIRGLSPMPGRITYSAPKAAVLMMTKIAAGEWAPYGIRVNAIAPGFVKTPMHEADVARKVFDEQHYLDVIPAGRFGSPAEIGRLAVYLCSDAASYITGACITIDGALTSIAVG